MAASVDSVLVAIEAAGWRWRLSSSVNGEMRVSLGQPEQPRTYRLSLECGNYDEGRHKTFEGAKLTKVLSEALVYAEREQL